MDATTHTLPTRAGLEHTLHEGRNVWHPKGSEARAERTAIRIAQAERWLRSRLGLAPSAEILLLDEATWPIHATFPVYGMPHFTDERTLAIAAGPAPFLAGFTATVVDRAAARDKARLAAALGAPPDPMRFFDLLAVHELGHLYQSARGLRWSQGWLSELHCNLVLHGYVADEEPAELDALTTLPDVGAHWPATHMRHQRLEAMHSDVDLAPENYGWFQMNLHALARKLWDADGAEGIQRLERHLGAGETVTPARLGAASPLLAEFHAKWPEWR